MPVADRLCRFNVRRRIGSISRIISGGGGVFFFGGEGFFIRYPRVHIVCVSCNWGWKGGGWMPSIKAPKASYLLHPYIYRGAALPPIPPPIPPPHSASPSAHHPPFPPPPSPKNTGISSAATPGHMISWPSVILFTSHLNRCSGRTSSFHLDKGSELQYK